MKTSTFKVRTVNRWIAEFNREATGVQLDLGVYGIEGDPMVGEVKILTFIFPSPDVTDPSSPGEASLYRLERTKH